MNHKEIDELRSHYDTSDTSADLERATLDAETTQNPMVGITVRLPADVLDSARAHAARQGRKVTALLRDWIEGAASEHAGDDRVVKVSDLRKLIAASTDVKRLVSSTPAQATGNLLDPEPASGE